MVMTNTNSSTHRAAALQPTLYIYISKHDIGGSKQFMNHIKQQCKHMSAQWLPGEVEDLQHVEEIEFDFVERVL